jgi:hypothetical protein
MTETLKSFSKCPCQRRNGDTAFGKYRLARWDFSDPGELNAEESQFTKGPLDNNIN